MSRLSNLLRIFTTIVIGYLALIWLLPSNKAAVHDYQLSDTSYHVLFLLVVLPLIATWFCALHGYERLNGYARAVKGTYEGKDFAKLSKGIAVLAWGSIISAIITLLVNNHANNHPGFLPSAVIIANYLGLLIPLIGFHYISRGSHDLAIRNKLYYKTGAVQAIIFTFMVIGVAYCYVVFGRLDDYSLAANNNPYYLPDWLMITTFVIPCLYTWFIGLLGAYDLYLYSRYSKGLLYQRGMRLLGVGFTAVIASSTIVQYLRTATPRNGHLSLNLTLTLINITYLLAISGYIMIIMGSNRLRKIEEV